jgi:lipoprotein-anchoring transpeptidase ErfK/SrfK
MADGGDNRLQLGGRIRGMTKLLFACLAASVAWLFASISPAAEKAVKAIDLEKVLRLQVWLDRQNFGPGKIDGKGGEFTSKAEAIYNEAHPEAPVHKAAPADFADPTLSDYTIREEDWKHVGALPESKEERAKLKALPYPTLEELVAERYHTDPGLLAALNPELKMAELKTGDVVKVPNVVPFEIEALRGEAKKEASPVSVDRSVDINAHEEFLRLNENGKVIAAFPVTVGSDQLPAPMGSWKVENVTALPEFRWDEKMLNEGTRSNNALTLPPGPRNPVGVYWMGLNKKGIGIHGTDSPWTIGRSASHGCIRLANWDAAKLAPMIKKGMAVEIH